MLPSITVHPENVHVQHNVSVMLRCKAVGGNSITYKWTRNNTVLKDQGTNGILTIDLVQQSDEGVYQCEAMNDRGEVAKSKEAILVVYGMRVILLHGI